jgi:hypothetical protein
MDLRMLVLCGGQERSLDDYGTLAKAAGLEVAGIRTAPGYGLIDCRLAGTG